MEAFFGERDADDLELLAAAGRGELQVAALAARGGALEHRFGAGIIDSYLLAGAVLFLAIVGVVGVIDAFEPSRDRGVVVADPERGGGHFEVRLHHRSFDAAHGDRQHAALVGFEDAEFSGEFDQRRGAVDVEFQREIRLVL